MLRSNVVPPAKYPEALAESSVQQSLVAQTPTLGLADGQSVAKLLVATLLVATLLQPVGLLKALEAFPIAPAISGFPSSGDIWVKDMPIWAKPSASVNCRRVK
jgi:hypothetical protein